MSARQQGSFPEHTRPRQQGGWVVLERLREIDPAAEGWEQTLTAVTSGVVDMLLEGDADALALASDPLRDALAAVFEDSGHAREVRGWLLGLLSVTRWGVQRLPGVEELELARGGSAVGFLRALEPGVPRSSGDLRARLGTGPTQVSRTGRELLSRGLVVQRRLGRHAVWELTPRGRQLLRGRTAGDSAAPAGRGGQARTDIGRPDGDGRVRDAGAMVAHAGPVRHVLPADGGWRIAKAPGARTIEHLDSKKQAVQRAGQIVKRSGGGWVCVHSRSSESVRRIDIGPH